VSDVSIERVELKVGDGSSMGAFVARPRAEGRYPGILVLQEAFGVNAHIRDVAQRFAKAGYFALAPELFHRTAPPGFEAKYDFAAVRSHYEAARALEPLKLDIKAGFDWLSLQPQVKPDKIAVIGFCMGGRAAFFANTVAPFCAAVSFYGGGIAPSPLDRAADACGPILMFWGGLDKNIPPAQIAAVTEGLRAAGKHFINVEFADADHGFFCDARSSYKPDAARQAWALTLEFLRTAD
jgi:carboxymethylenebutenolidase